MDKYGHINNMVYYGYFDTVVTEYIVRKGGLDTSHSDVVGLVVESQCNYFKPLSFPDILDCGLRIGRLGRSSVRYEIGIFGAGDESAAALGHFVHVYVTRHDFKPCPVPTALRAALAQLVMGTE